ncbi:MIP family channel protein [Paenibacillus sp. BR2-3]|uniref:MIP/aquaporin family protein n=1 Tax=Paenibacillus sp. BR2-3 TaxID=3048494 RepID=UPI0039778133
MKKTLLGECLAEFVGTYIFLFIGFGSVEALVAGGSNITWGELTLTWGLAVTLGVFIAGGVSGGHLNPAVTLALAVWNGFERRKVIPFIVSQLIGGFAAAASVYFLCRSGILAFEQAGGIVRSADSGWGSAGIFSTFPQSGLTLFQAGMVEMAMTAVLMLVILAVTDSRNGAAPKLGLAAISIGLTVMLLGTSFGAMTGFAMNPARDFGPRLFLMLAGWGSSVVGPHYYGLIVPIFGPIIGAIVGGGIYHKLIVPYYPSAVNASEKEESREQIAS